MNEMCGVSWTRRANKGNGSKNTKEKKQERGAEGNAIIRDECRYCRWKE